jgi:DNA polymerase III subunit chi
MTQVDFYVLKQTGARERFACRLAEQCYRKGHRIHIHTEDAGQAQRMDELLWTFKDGSFVPHDQQHAVDGEAPPVIIAAGAEPLPDRDLLLNLAPETPAFTHRFQRVADFVDGDEAAKAAGRTRWRGYAEDGCDVTDHQVDP